MTVSPLLRWLEEPRSDHAMSFADDDGVWHEMDYGELAARVRESAARICETPDEREIVALLLPNGPEFVAAFFGSLYAGRTPCPIAPPGFLQTAAQYEAHVASMLRSARPAAVVTTVELAPVAERVMDAAELGIAPTILELTGSGDDPGRQEPAELALLQFSSGSTGRPSGARVTWANLEVNVGMIIDWTRFDPERHATAMWLPLFHDMGLIGGMIAPVSAQGNARLMRPDQFIRWPERWVECFHDGGSTHTGAPTFAFGYAAKRVPEAASRDLDLSGWRSAIVGAERLDAAAMTAFAERFGPNGFDPLVYVPAYGLAEATVAVTGTPIDERPAIIRVDWPSMGLGQPVKVEQRARLGDGVDVGDGSGWLVDCGVPHPGLEVCVVDEAREPLPDGVMGEIAVRGPTVVDGYEGGDDTGSSSFLDDGTLLTGDGGVIVDGSLYVIGRLGDGIQVRGRNLFVEDLETVIAHVDGVRRGRSVVIAGPTEHQTVVAALVECEPGPWVDEVKERLVRAVQRDVTVVVLSARPGTIQRTSSGKPRRRVMWQALMQGELDAVEAARVQSRWTRERVSAATASGG
jgi:fatty-acyl-CoA synthase